MSYCVNCGVELESSEKVCPLCETEVLNPRSPWSEPSDLPYPKRREYSSRKLKKRFFAELLSALLLIPIFICFLCDLIATGNISWSLIVFGGCALFFVWLVLPLYFKKTNTAAYLAAAYISTLLFLFCLAIPAGGAWFFKYALPITLCAEFFVSLIVLIFKRRKVTFLFGTCLILFASGVFTVCVEVILGLSSLPKLSLVWSPFALIPCVALSLAALFIDSRLKLKEEIRKRLFF